MRKYALFGPAGNSDSFGEKGYKGNLDVPAYLIEMGLDCFEYQAGRGVKIKKESAEQFGAAARQSNIELSIHAPYYISLSSLDDQKRLNSARYMLESAAAITAMGGRRMVVHSGSVSKENTREQSLALALDTLKICMNALDEAGFRDVIVCPEVMGRLGQLGTLEEVLELCALDERILPCVDFGHLNARTQGGLKSKEDFAAAFDAIENRLGAQRLKNMHIHFSKIEYSAAGEKRHLTFEDEVFGPSPDLMLAVIAERGLTPTVICESRGTQAEDAAAMKRAYLAFLEK